MRFIADESCDFALVRGLRAAGHDVTAVAELARGLSDAEVVALAASEMRILLTEDRDFGRLVVQAIAPSVGVVYYRFPATARAAMVAECMDAVSRAGASLERAFTSVTPGRVRTRPLP